MSKPDPNKPKKTEATIHHLYNQEGLEEQEAWRKHRYKQRMPLVPPKPSKEPK
jgi:hypothetical protein